MSGSISETIEFENVYIFISDALRWKSFPEEMKNRGATFKTVASSCATMKAVSSILTGLYPPKHGVRTWRDKLAKNTLFDCPGMSEGYYNPAAGGSGGLDQVLGKESENTLDSIDRPFFYLERDKGGHAPYEGYSYDEMLAEVEHKQPVLESYYEEAISKSIERFDQRLETLEERGLLEDTLVVFLGDHGENIGEYGLVSHSAPPTPEVVYVPTMFIHPDLSTGVHADTIGQVDIAPTVLSALDTEYSLPHTDGVNLFKHQPGSRFNNANLFQSLAGRDFCVYSASSMWDENGGHVFNHHGKSLSPIIYLMNANGWNRAYGKENPDEIATALTRFSLPHVEYGRPSFTKSEARRMIAEIRSQSISSEKVELDTDVEKRLEDLGYRT